MASADAPRHDLSDDLSDDLSAARPPVAPDGPVTVGSLLRREGRAPHSHDRPVVPRARDVVDRGPAHRVAVTAGTILAVAAVLGTNVVGEVALGPGAGDDNERGFGGAVVPDPPGPLSLAATAAPVEHAMAVLRAAGSPVLAAMNDVTGARPASGAEIVARALAGLPGSPLVTVAAAATTTAASDDDRDGSASDTPGVRTSTRTSEADDTGSTRRQADRSTPTPRRNSGSAGTGSTPVRIPPVLSGNGPSGPSPSGPSPSTPGGGTVASPTTPVVPAPSTTPDPAPADPTGVAPDGGTGSTPADSPTTGSPKTGSADGGTAPVTTSARPDSSGSDGPSSEDSDRDTTSTTDGASRSDDAGSDSTADDPTSAGSRSSDSASESTSSDSDGGDSDGGDSDVGDSGSSSSSATS